MVIDWGVAVAALIAPLIAFLLNERLRPKLITWYVHSSAVDVHPNPGQTLTFHHHAIVVRNNGRRTANNVRLGHYFLPASFSVFPAIPHTVNPPGGGVNAEIVFPTLVPGEQVTITYLYFPPLIWSGVNSYIRSNEGMGRLVSVIPAIQYPRWVVRIIGFLLFLGFATALYGLIELGLRLCHLKV
jgi:uncharacterized repeat protein (TIGR01451 family)